MFYTLACAYVCSMVRSPFVRPLGRRHFANRGLPKLRAPTDGDTHCGRHTLAGDAHKLPGGTVHDRTSGAALERQDAHLAETRNARGGSLQA